MVFVFNSKLKRAVGVFKMMKGSALKRAWYCVGYVMVLLVSGAILLSSARAEGLDRVYEVQAQLTPTPLVVGTATPPQDILAAKLGPNIRRGQVQKNVDLGQGAYKLGRYRMQVRLHSGPHGGYDNGTMNYNIAAVLNRVTNNHTVSIFTRVKGVLKLHDGQAYAQLPTNRYFTGVVQIRAIAAGF